MNIFFTSYLMGGLGNQMFQIAHAISQGIKNKVDVFFLPDSFTPMQAKNTKNYTNNIFKNVNFVQSLPERQKIYEKSWNNSGLLNSIFFSSVEFHGYFQSSRNFLGYDEKIKTLFKPSEHFLNKIKLKFPDLLNENTVSLHIRRGDYLTVPDILPTLDLSYFSEGLKIIDGLPKIFIFTDDKTWVKENIKFDNQILVEGLEDWEELWLMSLCKHNIISNSSFSWWGAFLNENKDKKVIAPSVWFGQKGPNPFYNIYEKDWIKINVINKNNKLLCY